MTLIKPNGFYHLNMIAISKYNERKYPIYNNNKLIK